MSGGLEQIREGLTAHLNGKGIRAVPAWSGTAQTFPCGPVAAVSLRGCRWGPAGFQDYLGERYDPEAGRWEELYGRRGTRHSRRPSMPWRGRSIGKVPRGCGCWSSPAGRRSMTRGGSC